MCSVGVLSDVLDSLNVLIQDDGGREGFISRTKSHNVYLAVRPILAEPGKKVTGRVVLIDQYGNKHLTEKITFIDNPQPPEVFGVGRSTVNCFICGEVIAVEDLHPSASFATHKRCIR